MKTHEIKTKEIKTNDLYDAITNELDRVGGMLHICECLVAGEYEGADNCMEALLQTDRNGFMAVMYDTTQRFERTRELIRELGKRIPGEKAA